MKRIFLAIVMLCLALPAVAQSAKITAKIIDAETNQGIIGAVVEVIDPQSDKRRHSVSGAEGAVTVTGLSLGEYDMTVSFIGYTTIKKHIKLSESTTHLGNIALQEGVAIETVVKEVQALRTSQNGDTVAYNAAAFKVAADADVEGLIKKMPGITISNGQVEAQGEQIKKIFVDGKEFFGEDVSTALNSLPAQSVDRIEVFNKLSDNAEFSGMDDGEGYKAINIVTKSNMRQGVFGKLYGGYGYQPDIDGAPAELNFVDDSHYKPEVEGVTSHHKYNMGGNVNLFHGNTRVSIIGLFNNVNQQNFSFEDILGVTGGSGGGHGPGRGRGVGRYMVRPQSGVAQVGSIGVQYSDSWGEKDKLKLNGSYFFNQTQTKNKSITERWYYTPSPEDYEIKEGESETHNYNHRLNMRLDWKINENMSIMSRTNLSFQGNEPYSQQYGELTGESVKEGLPYEILYNGSEGKSHAYRFSEFLQYRVKLGKVGRTLTVDGRYATRQTPDSWTNSFSTLRTELVDGVAAPVKQYVHSDSKQGEDDISVNFTYTEPISKTSQLSLQYRLDYEDQQLDKRAYITEDNYAIMGEPNPQLSSFNTSTSTEHRVGPGFRYTKGKNTVVANVYYQHSLLQGVANGQNISKPFDNLTYFFMANMAFNPQNTIRLFVSSYTQNPDVRNLQQIPDLTNVQYITEGNPDLMSSYTHRVNFHYVRSNIEKGRTFMWMFSTQLTEDYMAQSIEYGKELEVDGTIYNPIQYSTYKNMDGYATLRTHVSYGFPIAPIKCNLNIMAGANWSKTPSMIDGKANYTSNMGYDATVSLGSNISENIDFTLQWNGAYNDATQSLAVRNKNNQYFSHTASGSLKWVFWKGFSITASANYNQYMGFTDDYNEKFLICNLYLGKKLFKNQLGEVLVGVNDLLNQNNAFVRTVGSGYTQNAWNSVVGRYFTVQFNYNLRLFGKNATRDMSKYEGMEIKKGGTPYGRPMPH
ncbi:MAG: outer membrane beta-barrel protein [Alistipes sp.]|nr:outer membrane beta-barrel protein [Alistipes sp.]